MSSRDIPLLVLGFHSVGEAQGERLFGCPRSSQVVSGRPRLSKVCLRLSQVGTGCLRSTQADSVCPGVYQADPGRLRLSTVVTGCPRSSQAVPGRRRLSQVVTGCPRSSLSVLGLLRLSLVATGCPRSSQTVPDRPRPSSSLILFFVDTPPFSGFVRISFPFVKNYFWTFSKLTNSKGLPTYLDLTKCKKYRTLKISAVKMHSFYEDPDTAFSMRITYASYTNLYSNSLKLNFWFSQEKTIFVKPQK